MSWFRGIKIELVKKGKSQKELAEYLGVSPNTVYRWVSGKVDPKMSTLEEIADWLDVRVLDLIISKKDQEKQLTKKE